MKEQNSSVAVDHRFLFVAKIMPITGNVQKKY